MCKRGTGTSRLNVPTLEFNVDVALAPHPIMPRQTIIVATDNKQIVEFITMFFSDTQSVPTVVRSKTDLHDVLVKDGTLVFLQSDWVDQRSVKRLNQTKSKYPNSTWIALGTSKGQPFSWSGQIDLPIETKDFRRVVFSKMEYPPKIRTLVVDDESEIRDMIQEYFQVRKLPGFEVRTATNGLEGFKIAQTFKPDCMILDIKMPVRTGIELYQDLAKRGEVVPTIFFMDSTSAEDIQEIRKFGTPVFIEKGGHHSTPSELLALVKKLVAFS